MRSNAAELVQSAGQRDQRAATKWSVEICERAVGGAGGDEGRGRGAGCFFW